MNIHNLDEEQMNVMKELAEANMKISTAKFTLTNLEQLKDEYIKKQEQEVRVKIGLLVKESKVLTDEIQKNYQEVKDFRNTVVAIQESMEEIYDKTKDFIEEFDKETIQWAKGVEKQNEELRLVQEKIQSDKAINEAVKRENEVKEKDLLKLKKLLESRQAALAVIYKQNDRPRKINFGK